MVKVRKLKLRPSARDKRRYFLVKATNKKVEDAILEYVGVLGFARSAYIKVNVSNDKKWDLPKSYVVGSCLVKSLDYIRAALMFAGVEIGKVSGTLKGLRGKA